MAGRPHQLEDEVAVDRVGRGVAQPDVVEGRLVAAEMQVLVLGRDRARGRDVLLQQGLVLLRLDPLDDVELAADQADQARAGIGHELVDDLLDLGRAENVVGVGVEDRRRPVAADELVGAGAVGELVDGLGVDVVLGQDRQEAGEEPEQRARIGAAFAAHPTGVVVDHLHLGLAGIPGAGRPLGIGRVLEGRLHVMRREGLATVELDVLAQRVFEPAVLDHVLAGRHLVDDLVRGSLRHRGADKLAEHVVVEIDLSQDRVAAGIPARREGLGLPPHDALLPLAQRLLEERRLAAERGDRAGRGCPFQKIAPCGLRHRSLPLHLPWVYRQAMLVHQRRHCTARRGRADRPSAIALGCPVLPAGDRMTARLSDRREMPWRWQRHGRRLR